MVSIRSPRKAWQHDSRAFSHPALLAVHAANKVPIDAPSGNDSGRMPDYPGVIGKGYAEFA
jgi:hypothetical protein